MGKGKAQSSSGLEVCDHSMSIDRTRDRYSYEEAVSHFNPIQSFISGIKLMPVGEYWKAKARAREEDDTARRISAILSGTANLAPWEIDGPFMTFRNLLNPDAYRCSEGDTMAGWEVKRLAKSINLILGGEHGTMARWEVVELATCICMILNGSAARGGKGGIAHLAQWELVKLMKQINKILNRCAARNGDQSVIAQDITRWRVVELAKWINKVLNSGAAGGGKGGTAHLGGIRTIQIEDVELPSQNNVLLNQDAARGIEGGTSHLAGIQIIQGGEVELANQNNVLLINQDAARGNKQPDSMPLKISTSPAYYRPGLAPGTSRPWNRASSPCRTQAVESHKIDINDGEPKSTDSVIQERINMKLNQCTTKGGEASTAHLSGMKINPLVCHLDKGLEEVANQNNVLPNQDADGGNMLPDSMPLNMSTIPAYYRPGLAPGTSRPWNRASSPCRTQAVESHKIDINDGEPKSTDSVIQERINMKLNQCTTKGGEASTAHLSGMKINPLVCHLDKGLEEVANQNNVLPNQDADGGNMLPDSMPLNMSTIPAYYRPGSAPETSGPRNRASSPSRTGAADSHNIDINNGKLKSTDSVIQESVGWSNALTIIAIVDTGTFSLLGTGVQGATVVMPKYCSRTILGLLALSLTCLFCIGIFYKKLPAKFANLATYLTYACNASAFFLLVGFYMANM